ncbi:hypothetical protein GCM10009609_74610 [Pseudonocardia aurantiaca]|uniref:Uncharacterized protein n=1 Tax=Pseudonocardia aurantiaca TaxID=75290 RepID=A0ABW4FJ53_9PSEU
MTEHPVLDRPTACPPPRDRPAATAEFVDVVCADGELLRAEFDAIIAANFPPEAGQACEDPPRRPAPPLCDRAHPERSRSTGRGRRPDRTAIRAARRHRARQRGPPPNGRREQNVDPGRR